MPEAIETIETVGNPPRSENPTEPDRELSESGRTAPSYRI